MKGQGELSYEFFGCRNEDCDAYEEMGISLEDYISISQWLVDNQGKKVYFDCDEKHIYIELIEGGNKD